MWPKLNADRLAGGFSTPSKSGYIDGRYIRGYGAPVADLNDGEFHHFAIVKDGTDYFEYIDGGLSSQDTGRAIGPPASPP